MSLWRNVFQKIELPQPEGTTRDQIYLSNEDLRPVVTEKRTWGKWTYGLFWFGAETNVISWTIASTGVTSGLSWWEAWLCVILGQSFNSLFVTANGRPGAVYHVNFPVISRASFGIWGSYWPVFNRNVMSLIWCGVQIVTAGNCFYVALHAIFPSIANVPNPFGPDVTMTGGRLIGFVLSWLANLSCAFFEVHKFKMLIPFKACVMMICLLSFFGWAVHLAGGVGPIISQGSNIPDGESKGWIFVQVMFIMAANEVTFSVNASDTTRYARKPNDALWPPLFCHPLATTIVALFGILVTSSSSVILGQITWDPLTILDEFLAQDYSSSRRAGVFFIAGGFAFAQVTGNIFETLIACGNDTAALLPRFVNIRRGIIFMLVLAFAINPWQLTNTSFTFTNYLGSYQIFLASILGVTLCDYFFVKKGYVNTEDLFHSRKDGIYHYTGGWNWRAYAAYLAGMVPVFPGFLNSIGVKGIPEGAIKLFYLALPVGIFVGAAVYYPLNYFWPPRGGMATTWHEEFETSFLTGMEVESNSSLNGVEVTQVQVSDVEKKV